MVYLLHFAKNYRHAKHYIGFVDGGEDELQSRLQQHRAGTGIDFELVRVWPNGDRNFERRLKNMKKASQYCPICKTERKTHVHTSTLSGTAH
ncbi:MAG: endonuclease [Peptococcaceae bacterium]|nr:MAG: endonuclease [Peptococcaceae bacterium]